MAALSVVELDPGCKGSGPVGVGGEDSAVGPFALQGAVLAFHLAVLPGAVRLDEQVSGVQLVDDCSDVV